MNIPEELKKYKQWVVWKTVKNDKGKITKPPYSVKSGQRASIQNPAHWVDFETAVKAMPYYDGIGFVLTENDPFCCIDFDNHGGKCVLEKHELGAKHFKSFCEVSPSGNGLHVWLKGSVPSGREIPGIGGVYSKDRYITITGNTFIDAPIQTANGSLTKLWESGSKPIAPQVAPKPKVNTNTLSDNDLLSRAYNAINADKFKRLCYGDWQGYYPSASESDYALVDCIAYYTQDDEQVARIFLNSPAGSRDKYKTNPQHHLWNRMIPRCRDKQIVQPVIDFTALNESFKQREAAMKVPPEPPKQTREIFSEFPKGLVGEIAQFVYDNSASPVREISLAAALGFMAGICGRCYNINRAGLNVYILLLATTGRGKEELSNGISSLVRYCDDGGTKASDFIGPSTISSSQALTKAFAMSGTKSMYCLLSEFSATMTNIFSSRVNPIGDGLRQVFLKIYGKSGYGNEFGWTAYSDSIKNIPSTKSPAFSFIGESQPSEFYPTLSDRTFLGGFIPRFHIIEYAGNAKKSRKNWEGSKPDALFLGSVQTLISTSRSLNHSDKAIDVELDEEAYVIMDAFEDYSISKQNKHSQNKDYILEALWVRSYLKALKIAGLIAVGQNSVYPKVDRETAQWAVDFTKAEIGNTITKLRNKSYGISDQNGTNMTGKIEELINEWINLPEQKVKNIYGKSGVAYHQANLIPISFFVSRCGASRLEVLRGSIDMMIRSGYIVRLTDDQVRLVKDKSGIVSVNPKQAEVFAVDQSFFDKLNGEVE